MKETKKLVKILKAATPPDREVPSPTFATIQELNDHVEKQREERAKKAGKKYIKPLTTEQFNDLFKEDPFSCQVLRECIELQKRKAHDYQNPNSTVKQIDYYPHGLQSIYDICHAKMLRIRSLLESGVQPENEALEDSFRDLINYSSFAVAYIHKKIPGQE